MRKHRSSRVTVATPARSGNRHLLAGALTLLMTVGHWAFVIQCSNGQAPPTSTAVR